MTLAHDLHQISRTQDVQITHNITFDTMLLGHETLQGLKSSGFYKPSPIQLHGIPLGKCGFDLLLEAKSGTGKTAVFTVIALEKIELTKGLQVVILAPTREIAAQICEVIKHIGSGYEGLVVEVVMGGLPVKEDIEKFKRNVHIVVASPGRFRHLIQDKHIDTSSVRLLVLDEADKLMEISFQADVKHIFSFLPIQKQVIMSSATYTETAKSFIKNYVQNAQHVCPDSNCVLLGVDQKICLVKYNSNIVNQTQIRFQEILKIFTKMQFKQCLIFCNYQVRVSELHKLLLRAKWPAEQLYGSQEQTDRLDALKTLQEYKCRVLIATDLAARGIDASNIDLVINFEPPFEWQTYLHRIGRAGRYGSYGMAITILSEGVEAKKFHKMLEPMKETIHITDLWCNSEISKADSPKIYSPDTGDSLDVLQANNKEIKKEFKELWNMLTSNEPIKNNFESFENLCASFDNSKSNIQTFDELLQSFDSDQIYQNEDLNFKHVNINSGPCKYICNSYKRYLNILEKQQSDNNNISETCSVKAGSVNIYQTENEQKVTVDDSKTHNNVTLSSSENGHDHLIKKVQHNECINDSANTTRKSYFDPKNINEQNVNAHNTRNDNAENTRKALDKEKTNADDSSKQDDMILISAENHDDYSILNIENNVSTFKSTDTISNYNFDERNLTKNNNNSHDTRKALLDAGLPTEFGKVKKSNNLRYHTNHSRPNKIYSENKNTRSLPYNSLEIKNKSSCENNISNDIKTRSGKYLQNKKNINAFDNESFVFNGNHRQQMKCKCKSKNSKAAINSDAVNEAYAVWYRNLKLQTKQIELAVYIDELSKL